MIKSPLRYPGGKSRAIGLISGLIPEFDEYREPFLGGGSLFVYVKQKYSDKKFWINDIYNELFLFWKMCREDINEVINQIYLWRKRYTEGKELHQFLLLNLDSFNEIEKAAAFFIFNRITFSGTSLSGGYSNLAFKGRFTESSIERLKKLGSLLNSTVITSLDYEEVVLSSGENVFIFLDPPYYSATKSALYGKNGNLHKTFDHIRFSEVMKNCNHKWLITYDNSEYVKELFSFANIFEWDLKYGMRNVSKNSDQTGKELFISNYIESFIHKPQMALFNEI